MDRKLWVRRRESTLAELRSHMGAGRVDKDIIPLLNTINSLNYAFTTSSCSGRIQVYAASEPGEKFGMRTLGKWHSPITLGELMETLENEADSIWMAVLPPILHIAVCSVKAAFHLLGLLRSAGFKRAGIISASEDGITLEAVGTERMEAPLRLSGMDIFREDAIPLIVERANSLLTRSKGRIRRLKEVLMSETAGGLDNLCWE
ncbi:MAG: hypothetical protein QI197_04515 [Candidatus Korarchaeota archaeon]|nr:hypothetical protein [Candidatus Korarchaeota archaeon]